VNVSVYVIECEPNQYDAEKCGKDERDDKGCVRHRKDLVRTQGVN
jgi:hypothetical protein